MLVLTRKRGERVVIGGNIEVVVLAAHGSRVKLGFTAPDEVRIVRDELREKTAGLAPRVRRLVPTDRRGGEVCKL